VNAWREGRSGSGLIVIFQEAGQLVLIVEPGQEV
jgi:hypothetical protein